MKVVAIPIKIDCYYIKDLITPLNFSFVNEKNNEVVIKINRVVNRTSEKLAGNKMLIFDCMALVNNEEKLCQLKLELSSCKWMLFKI